MRVLTHLLLVVLAGLLFFLLVERPGDAVWLWPVLYQDRAVLYRNAYLVMHTSLTRQQQPLKRQLQAGFICLG